MITKRKEGFLSMAAVVCILLPLLFGCETGVGEGEDNPPGDPPFMEMVYINGGTFLMGGTDSRNTADQSSSMPQHLVRLTGFYMGKYEVTQAQWYQVMGATIEELTALYTTITTNRGRGDDYPIYYVSWYDALVFCNKLSVSEGLTPAYSISINGEDTTDPDEWGAVPMSNDATWNDVKVVSGSNGYRLPTEAQWEYACRAGTTTAWHSGDTADTVDDYAWHSGNSSNTTHEVGTKKPNPWGLFDMHGNIREWCWDWRGDYEIGEVETDPVGPSSGPTRVTRGGPYGNAAQNARSARRIFSDPYDASYYIGIRLARPAQ